jgi:TonB family protein
LRTYATSERNDRREEWKKIAATAKRTMLSLLPGRGRPDQYTGGNLDRPEASNGASAKRPFDSRTLFRHTEHQPLFPPAPALAVAGSLRSEVTAPPLPEPTKAVAPFEGGRIAKQPVFPEVSGLPMVINRKPPPKAVPWLSMAMVFVVFSGVTFAFLALKGINTGSGKLSQIMQVLFPGTDLELRAEGRGDRLLLTWNRKNAMVASAATAVLAISDGTQRFEKKLDAAQIADGSVLYKPMSGDVTFRLQVVGADQGIAVASLRVLDATNPAGHDGPILDLSNPGATTPPAAAQTAPPAMESKVPGATAEMPAGNRTSANQAVPTLPVANRTTLPHYNPPVVPKQVPEATTTVIRQARELPKPVVPPPSATQQQQQQSPPPQQPAQTAAQQPSTPAPAIPKPAPPQQQQQQPAARTPATTPQTSGTEIKGWDPNISENKAPAAVTQADTQAAAPDSKAVAFIGPKVLLQVMPNTRNLTPGSITQTTRVEVEVRVDNSGHVKAAHLLNNNVRNQLGAAAVAAAKQWTFQPATLRGQKVESDHTIVFEFRPEGQ